MGKFDKCLLTTPPTNDNPHEAIYVDRGATMTFKFLPKPNSTRKFFAWTGDETFQLTAVIWNGEFAGLKAKFENGNRARFVLEIEDFDHEIRDPKNQNAPQLEERFSF